MSTEWFHRQPGEQVAHSEDTPNMVLLGSGAPDWVRLPPELGGDTLRVRGHFRGACPKCEACPDCAHLVLDADYGVAECVAHGFLWYRRRRGAE